MTSNIFYIFILCLMFQQHAAASTNSTQKLPTQQYLVAPTLQTKTTMASLLISKLTTLQDICRMFRVPPENCTCSYVGNLCQLITAATLDDDKAGIGSIVVCNKIDRIEAYVSMVICLIGIFGNLLVILVSVNYKRNTICRRLIGALALSDLLFSVLQTMYAVPRIWTCEWLYGTATCKFLISTINTTACTALGFILIISMERYNGIVKPFLNNVSTRKKLYLMSAVNVLIGILVAVPAMYALQVERLADGSQICMEKWSGEQYSLAYSWALMFTTFIIPIFTISLLYGLIVKSLRVSQKHTRGTFDKSQQTRRKKEDDRIIVITACLLIAFAVLVSPNRVVWVLYDHGVFTGLSPNVLRFVKMASYVPYLCHASVNPIIYSIIDSRFRQSLKRLCCGMIGRPTVVAASKRSSESRSTMSRKAEFSESTKTTSIKLAGIRIITTDTG